MDDGSSAMVATEGLADRVINHFKTVFPTFETRNEPYQHFAGTGVFPDDVYAHLIANLPPRKAYTPFNPKRWHDKDGNPTRLMMSCSEAAVAGLDPVIRPFWTEIVKAVKSDAFRRVVYRMMSEDIALRMECAPGEVLEVDAWPNVMLIRDYAEYRIKPHPDGQPRVVTLMFYLAPDQSQADLGTSVYVRNSLGGRLTGQPWRETYRFPFLPNSCAAFAVNDTKERRSIHGRELITGDVGQRNTLLVTWQSRAPGQEAAA